MNFISKIFGREKRSSEINTSDPYLSEFFNQRTNATGFIDQKQATGLATAHACISIVSQALASVPLNLYRRTENSGREKAADHPLFQVLHDTPNKTMTAFEAREFLIASLLVAGNAYAHLAWNGKGQVTSLEPIDPASVSPERLESGRTRYRVTDQRGSVRVHVQEEILHIRYRLSQDGLLGLSPIQIARETFGLALSQQNTANKQASKSFRTEGALVFPQSIGADGKEKALTALQNRIESQSTTSGVLVLDGGVDYKPLSLSARDAEFLESRKLTNLDICRVFGVPPTVAGITDNATYSNTDQESRALVVRCLSPMAKRIEQSMNTALLPAMSRKTLFIEHDLAGLLRGDLKGRYEAYRIGREWGWLSPNEIRGWENLPEIDAGDEYLSPLNMTNLTERNSE